MKVPDNVALKRDNVALKRDNVALKRDNVAEERNENIIKEKPSHRTKKMSFRKRLEMFELILDSIHNGIMVTDADGYITHFNRPYGHFLGI